MESNLNIVRDAIPDPEERFLDFRASFRKHGPGLRIHAKWPAMEKFVREQGEKDYGALENYFTHSKHATGARLYPWSGRVAWIQGWEGPSIVWREKDPLWSGDTSYFNIWWCLLVGLGNGVTWDMRFPPDSTHMEGYCKLLSQFAQDFGDKVSRPYEITLAVNMKVMK